MRFPHELQDEFPDMARLIERLTKTNYEFGRLATAYDEVNAKSGARRTPIPAQGGRHSGDCGQRVMAA